MGRGEGIIWTVIQGRLPDCIQKMEKQRCLKRKIQLEKLQAITF